VIFVTVGTDHHPFVRLLEWAAQAQKTLDVEVVAQRGATPNVEPIESFEYAEIGRMEALARSAHSVVCHGGPGTIDLARRCGHRPIVVPRAPDLGEHVDDHQMRYCARLAADGEIDIAHTFEELIELLSTERPAVRIGGESEDCVGAFSEVIDDLMAGRLRRRPWRVRVLVRRSP